MTRILEVLYGYDEIFDMSRSKIGFRVMPFAFSSWRRRMRNLLAPLVNPTAARVARSRRQGASTMTHSDLSIRSRTPGKRTVAQFQKSPIIALIWLVIHESDRCGSLSPNVGNLNAKAEGFGRSESETRAEGSHASIS